MPSTNAIPSPLLSEATIADRIETMAREMVQTLPQDVMLVALLKGSFVFAADLIRAMHRAGMRPQVDFLTIGSYGAGTKSSGKVTLHRDITEAVEGRDIVLVDDILESGGSLRFAKDLIAARGAKTIHIAVLLEKAGKCKHPDIKGDFVGFSIPDRFVVGYGLDYANSYRELPYIGMLEG